MTQVQGALRHTDKEQEILATTLPEPVRCVLPCFPSDYLWPAQPERGHA